MRNKNSFYDAWWFLHEHGIFALKDCRFVGKTINCLSKGRKRYRMGAITSSMFFKCLDVYVAKVNPKNRRVEKDARLNTETEVWLESGPWYIPPKKDPGYTAFPEGLPSHDYRLDCGAPTYEEAIIKLAYLVRQYYGKKAKPRVLKKT